MGELPILEEEEAHYQNQEEEEVHSLNLGEEEAHSQILEGEEVYFPLVEEVHFLQEVEEYYFMEEEVPLILQAKAKQSIIMEHFRHVKLHLHH